MAFNNAFTAVTGATYTAAQYNTYTRDNLTAIWVYTAAGDIAYASSATTLARLAKGTAYQMFRMNAAASAPEWGQPNIKTMLHYNATGHSYNSTAERDMPNSSNTITLDIQSTILVWARIQSANAPTNCWTQYCVNIDGVNSNFANWHYGSNISVDFPAYGRKAGVTAGVKTIKLREKEGYGAGLSYSVGHLEWLALAIPE